MAKLTLNNVTNFADNSTAVTTTSANNDAIEAFAETVLSRDGTHPNAMNANIDMNSNRIINLATPTNNSDAATKFYVDDRTGNAPDHAAAAEQSALEAAQSAQEAAASAADAEETLEDFQNIYYGSLAADPATRPDGSPRQDGDLYKNTSTASLRVFHAASGTWVNSTSFVITEDVEYSFGTGGDFATFAEAVEHANNIIPLNGASITLRGKDEILDVAAPVEINHPYGAQIILCGPQATALTGVSLVSIDSSGGPENHEVTLEFSGGVSVCKVGRYIHVVLANGTGDFENLNGHFEILNVDEPNNQITVRVTDKRAAFNATTLSSATIFYIPSALRWTGTSGITVLSKLVIQDITLIGDKTASLWGLGAFYNGFVTLQSRAAVVKWARGVYAIFGGVVLSNYGAACDCGNGWYAIDNASISGAPTIATGNNIGFVCSAGAHMAISGAISAGNGVNVLVSGGGSNFIGQGSKFLRSTSNSIEVDNGGFADFSISTVSGAGAYGIEVDGGGKFRDAGVTYSSNTSGDRNILSGVQWSGAHLSLVVQDFGIDKAQGTLTFNASGTASDIRDGATSGHIEIRPNSQNRDVIFKVRATDAERARIDMTDGSYQFANGVHVYSGSGSPEGAQTAVVGSIWLRSNGGASTTLYVKESGSGNTGWVAK